MNTYFTYHLFHKPTGKHYYGVRYANGSDPLDLWTTYFSSSRAVHDLIKEYGRDSFIATVRKTFTDKLLAKSWEERFLTKVKAATNENWLNQSNGGRNFINNRPLTDEHIRKMKESLKGRKFSEDHRRKISEALKGRIVSDAAREKMSLAKQNISDETRRKISENNKKRGPISEETRNKMRESHRSRPPMSDETRRKISESRKGKKYPKSVTGS